jgi:flagellar hook-basal body complex protein FliE
MTVMPSAAAAAYQALAKIGGNVSGTAGAAAPTGLPGGGSFGDFLSNAMKDSMTSLKAGEQTAMAQTAGQADVVNVVTAVNNAELTLDTVVAIRDKVIGAYQDIMKMPI